MKGKYLITGATGLIGSAIVRKLSSDGCSLTCPIRNLDKVKAMFSKDIFDKVRWIETSLEDYANSLSEDFDYIIHCASPTASKYFVEHHITLSILSIPI